MRLSELDFTPGGCIRDVSKFAIGLAVISIEGSGQRAAAQTDHDITRDGRLRLVRETLDILQLRIQARGIGLSDHRLSNRACNIGNKDGFDSSCISYQIEIIGNPTVQRFGEAIGPSDAGDLFNLQFCIIVDVFEFSAFICQLSGNFR